MPQGQIEDIKKNTGTAVPTEVSAQEVNPMQQPNINVNQQEVNAVAQGTNQSQAVQQANTTVQQPATQPQDLKFTELNGGQVAQQGVNAMMGAMDYSNIKNSDAVLSQLIQGQPVDGTGLAVDNARERYDNYKSLSGMSYKEIGDTILSGDMAKNGTSMSDLRTYNPQLWQQVRIYVNQQDELNNLNNLGTSLYDNYNSVEDNDNYTKYTMKREEKENITDTGASKSIITTYSDDIIDFIKSYQTNATQLMNLASNMLNNPTIQQYKNNILELEGKIANIQTDIEYVGDEARQMLGSSAPESLVSAYISQQTKALQRQLMTYNNSLLVEQGKLDSAVDDVKTKLDYYMKGMELGTDALQTLMGGIGGGSSSSGLTTSNLTSSIGSNAIKNLKDDILNGSFGWKFNETALKKYGLTQVDEDEILNAIAQSLVIDETTDELLAVKKAADATNYQKILNKYVSAHMTDLVNLFKDNKDNLSGIAEWLDKYGFTKNQVNSVLTRAGFTDNEKNKIYKEMGLGEGTTDLVTGNTAEAVSGIVADMISGKFGWKFDNSVLKGYGISPTSENDILKAVANAIKPDDLLTIKSKTSNANYQKLLKAFISEYEGWFVQALRPTGVLEDDLYSVVDFLKKYGIAETEGKKILKSAGYDTDARNKISSYMNWGQEKTSGVSAISPMGNTVTGNTATEKYVKTMNQASGGIKTATDTNKKAFEQLSQGVYPTPTQNYEKTGQGIGGVASNYSEYSKIFDNAKKLEFKGDNASDNSDKFRDGISAGYYSSNWSIWTNAIKKIGEDPQKIKIYLEGILGPNFYKNANAELLLKNARLSNNTITQTLQKPQKATKEQKKNIQDIANKSLEEMNAL